MSVIIEKFGGVRPMARAIGRRETSTTLQYWKSQGYMPRSAMADVERALIERGVRPATAKEWVTSAVAGGVVKVRRRREPVG